MVDPTMIDQNLDLKERLASVIDRATQDAIALLLAQREIEKPTQEPMPDWMTASQLARYWQLVNANGEPTTAGIVKWPGAPTANTLCLMLTWATFCGFTEMRLTCGREKKLKGEELKTKNVG